MTSSSSEDEIRQDIERTRAQLGETVEALAHKVDVPARVKDKMHDTKQTVQAKAEQATQRLQESTPALQAKAGEMALPLVTTARQRPIPTTAVAVGVLLVLLLVLRRLLRGS